MSDLGRALSEADGAVSRLAHSMPNVRLRQTDMVSISVGSLDALVNAITTSREVIDAPTAGSQEKPKQTGMRVGFDGKLYALMSDGSQKPVFSRPPRRISQVIHGEGEY